MKQVEETQLKAELSTKLTTHTKKKELVKLE